MRLFNSRVRFSYSQISQSEQSIFLINRSDWLLFFEYEYKLMLKYFITIRLTDVSLKLTDVSLRLTYVSLIQLDKQNKTQTNK